MKKRIFLLVITALLVVSIGFVGCTEGSSNGGMLQFYANGEDFVRRGFVSKDGWSISFDHVYITLTDVTAYQSDPPYDSNSSGEVKSKIKVSLSETYTVDLAEGGEAAVPILVGELNNVPVGHYNAISWKLVKAISGPADGHSLVIVGTAEKTGKRIDFIIRIDGEYEYTCGEFVGDERKGMVREGGMSDLEMTFHFDHIFGDAETSIDDELNVGAVGFEPFVALAEGMNLDVDVAELQAGLPAKDYKALMDMLPTLGHVGEGHCHCR